MEREQIIRSYDEHYNPSLALLFELAGCPIEDTATGAWIRDHRGVELLDFAAGYGVFSVGHGNARVQQAVLRQLDELSSAPACVAHQPRADLLDALSAVLPPELCRIYLAGSGSEAIEIALRYVALAKPDRSRMIAATTGFHGKTVGAVGLCGQDYLRVPFEPIWSDVQFVPYGDLGAMQRAVGSGVAAVFLEPVLGGGYVTTPPSGYLRDVRELCDRTETLLVCDEVQTGFGRTGKMFAFEHDGAVPDVLIVSKGMTGGHVSMAAAIVRDSIVSEVEGREPFSSDPWAYASDSCGWPIACAAAKAAIDFIVEERLPERAAEYGEILQEKLRRVVARHPDLALGVPGKGLMTGVRVRNNMLENALWLQMLKRKVIVGLSTNPKTPTPVMRFFPPLTVTTEQIDTAVAAFDASLAELRRFPNLVLDVVNQLARFQYHIPRPLMRQLASLLGRQ